MEGITGIRKNIKEKNKIKIKKKKTEGVQIRRIIIEKDKWKVIIYEVMANKIII